MTAEAMSPDGAKPPPRWLKALRALRDRKMAAMLLLAFAAGIPYGAVLGTLNAWLTAEGITPSQIGVLNFIILAYSFKLIWAPGFQKAWFPRIGLPFLQRFGPRRSWILSMQLLIAVMLSLLALSHPGQAIGYVAIMSVLIAISSSVHDIVLEAWRIEIAESDEDKDLMSAIYQFGYRIAGLFTGLFALMMADHIPWQTVYLIIAIGMILATVGTFIAPEPKSYDSPSSGRGERPSYAAGLKPGARQAAVGLTAAGWLVAIGIIAVFFVQSLTQIPPPSTAVFTRVQAPIIVALLVILPGAIAAWLLRGNSRAAPHTAPAGGPLTKAVDALFHTILDPMMDLVQRLRWAVILVLALVLMYRFVDLIWGGFAYPFYLGKDYGALGHSNSDVAIASKTIGVFMTIAGSMAGGAALIFIGRLPCLFIGAVLSAATNLIFADLAAGAVNTDAFLHVTGLASGLAAMGVDLPLSRLIVAIAGENLAGGFASVAFVAYLTSMVNPKFAAVQYALLGSLVMMIGSLGRAELGTYIETDGFHDFFVLTAQLGLIAVVLCGLEWSRHALGGARKDKSPEAAPSAAA